MSLVLPVRTMIVFQKDVNKIKSSCSASSFILCLFVISLKTYFTAKRGSPALCWVKHVSLVLKNTGWSLIPHMNTRCHPWAAMCLDEKHCKMSPFIFPKLPVFMKVRFNICHWCLTYWSEEPEANVKVFAQCGKQRFSVQISAHFGSKSDSSREH
jgi:hypothetical protein